MVIRRLLAVVLTTAALCGLQSVAVAGQPEWSTRAPMPTARNGVDAVATDGIAYVIGGQGCSDTTGSACFALDTVEAFSPARNAWRTMAPMPAPRMQVGATLGRDGRIYVAGGSGPGGVVADTFYAYSPRVDSWRTLAPLPSARAEPELATADGGDIYAFGGYTGAGFLRLVEAYNPSGRTWSSRTSMPSGRRGHAVVAAPDGLIYVIGGQGEGPGANWLASVDVYNPVTDTWKAASPMPRARASFGAVLGSDGRIYAVGGYNDSGYLTAVDAYDPSTNAWSTVAPLKLARAGLAVASVSNRLLAIGGEQVNGPDGFLSNATEECRCLRR
jgi:N-acetylneuraminic acid mutarotase